jgi:hypothetical protein
MAKKEKSIHGGTEEGIGIAEDVTKPSSKMNDCDGATSSAGKILKKKPAAETEHE